MGAPTSEPEGREEILVRGQRAVLESLAAGTALPRVLESLCGIVEEACPGTLCSILLLTDDGLHLHHAAAPSLPAEYRRLIDGIAIGPEMGSCGTAAYRREQVVVPDIATDPLWRGYAAIAGRFGLASSASTPILAGPDARLLGTFAIYHRTVGPYAPLELAALRSTSHLAGIAILGHLRDEALQESLTRPAGLAHDFNNLLTAILCNVSFAQAKTSPQSVAGEALEAIDALARRAGDLTRQLTHPGKAARAARKPLDLNPLAKEIVQTLSASLAPGVRIELDLSPTLPLITGDPSQIHQVVVNLVLNAAQAIEATRQGSSSGDAGGTIRVRTATAELRDEDVHARFAEQRLAPGGYVLLEVSDTGSGIASDVMGKIFDPFFTTKPTGRGIGLAVSRGILRDHRAGIEVESEVGRGSSFRIYLPVSPVRTLRPSARDKEAYWPGSNGKVLLFDEDPVIRSAIVRMLSELGFDALEASDGQDALLQLAKRRSEISLVLFELATPSPESRAALAVLRERWPDLRVILMVGTEEPEADALAEGERVLTKPYGLLDLKRAIAGDGDGAQQEEERFRSA